MAGENSKVYKEHGGARQVVASGGSLDVESGGELDIESGASLKLAGTAIAATAAEINRAADVSARVVNLTAATLSLTEATHDGKTVTVNKADGATITLPAATGSGARFRIVIGTTLTSGSLVIQVTGDDTMQGQIQTMSDDPATVKAFAAAATSDTITLNRTTTGVGAKGEWFLLEDIAADLWQVHGVTTSTGTEATPFSAAV